MSLWHYELCRLDGDIRVYVKTQDDYSGNINEGIRQTFCDEEGYYFRADGKKYYINTQREEFLIYEDNVNRALKIMRDNNL